MWNEVESDISGADSLSDIIVVTKYVAFRVYSGNMSTDKGCLAQKNFCVCTFFHAIWYAVWCDFLCLEAF